MKTFSDLRDHVSMLLDIEVPASILRAAMLKGDWTLERLDPVVYEDDFDIFLEDVLARCQAFDVDTAWAVVFGGSTVEEVVQNNGLRPDREALGRFLYACEAEAVAQGAEVDFSSFSARSWHDHVVLALYGASQGISNEDLNVAAAVDHLRATLQEDGLYRYDRHPEGWIWHLTSDQMAELGRALRSDDREGYASWMLARSQGTWPVGS